jgi:cytoskeletal protein CcmA (bactofilin family)
MLKGVLCLVVGCVATALSLPATARSEARDVGIDHFAAGSSVRVDRVVAGDLLAAGGQVDVAGRVRGDAIVAGGNVRLGGGLDKSLYAAGGQLTLAGAVANNVRAAGGEVTLLRGAEVGGNASLAGGRVEVGGVIKGYLQAAGGELFIDGAVGGDVIATSGRIELGPQARIAGRLRYASRDEAVIDPAAQIVGGIERMTWRARAGIPSLAALILIVTLIGLPLGLVTLLAYFAVLPVGYAAAAIAIGDGALARVKPAADAAIGWRVGAAALAVLVLALLARLPYLGALLVLAALLIGLGALMLQLKPQLRRSPDAV